MDNKKMRWFLNRITSNRYVNLHFDDLTNPDNRVKDILTEIINGNYTNDYCIDVDIRSLIGNDKGKKLADIINRKMAAIRFPHWIRDSLSIEHTLEQFDKRLDRAAIIIFQYFQNPDDEKEKNILNSLRIFMDKNNPLYVQILIISSKKTEHWDLAPYSLLDERLVEYIPWSDLQ